MSAKRQQTALRQFLATSYATLIPSENWLKIYYCPVGCWVRFWFFCAFLL